MPQDKDALGELAEAIEKARGLIRGGSSKAHGRVLRSLIRRNPTKVLARNPKFRGGQNRKLLRAESYLMDRLVGVRRRGGNKYARQGVYKSKIDFSKAKPKTLYVYRPVENAEDILAWARGAGFKSLLPAEKLHVTIIASATEINWANLFDDYHLEPNDERKAMCDCGPVYRFEDRAKTKKIEGGVREVKKLGDKGAVVLGFESLSLTSRWLDLRRAGAVSKFSAYQPHITLTLSGDLPKDIQPYNGPIILGEECWEEFKDGAYENVEEVVTKAGLDALNARLAALEAKPAVEAA